MDYFERTGLEKILELLEEWGFSLSTEDRRFIGNLHFLEKIQEVRKIEPMGITTLNYVIYLSKKMTRKQIERMFHEHVLYRPIRVEELPVREDLKDVYFVFQLKCHTYRVFVQNPR